MTTNWEQKQKECRKCFGFGYVQSELRHEDGQGGPAWAARCECQPQTLEDWEEAIAQEKVKTSP
jgi:hypothetical protein